MLKNLGEGLGGECVHSLTPSPLGSSVTSFFPRLHSPIIPREKQNVPGISQIFAAMDASSASEVARIKKDPRYSVYVAEVIAIEVKAAIRNAEQAVQNVYWVEEGVLPGGRCGAQPIDQVNGP